MTPHSISGGEHPRLGRRALAAAFVGLLASVTLLAADRDLRAADVPPVSAFVPELGLPATGVVAFGASPAEAPDEVWAYGRLGPIPPAADRDQRDRYALLRHTLGGAWQVVPLPDASVAPFSPEGFPTRLGALAGQVTPAGSVALMAPAAIVLRDPGGTAESVPPPGGADLLAPGESVPPDPPPAEAPTPYAVVDEDSGSAGLLIAPYAEGPPAAAGLGPGVLHYDGAEWSREPLEAPEGERFRALAIACAPTAERPNAVSAGNCWLLAGLGEHGHLALFRRDAGGGGEEEGPTWAPVEIDGGLLGSAAGEPPAGAVSAAAPGPAAQMLTATSQGVWVDFVAAIAGDEPRGASELVLLEGDGARVAGSWCRPSGPGCAGELGASFPPAYRSFAWPGSSPADPGTRLVTGLAGRAVLRLEGGAFAYADGPGGSPGAAPGGSAWLSPQRGIVADGIDPSLAPDGAGQSQVIQAGSSQSSQFMAGEPIPARAPLLAVAPEPGSEPGAADAEALAVGKSGEVVRFVPGSGWRQDAVIGADQHSLPTLRGIAWPRADRAFAVGEKGAIWSWSPAEEAWRAGRVSGSDLNAIAFSHFNPDRGFAVGDGRILSRAGEGWSEESLPPGLSGSAVFTSVAFGEYREITGDPALAAYSSPGGGGLLVEDGSGWRVDSEFAELLAAIGGTAPMRVAGLPDGGALVAGPGYVIKREIEGSPWRLSPQPLPEARSIAALAAYRDSEGALRALVSIGLGPLRPGPGAQPIPASGYLLRETNAGWSDLEHAALPVTDGSTDMPLRPEPVLALLVAAGGETGLAVGGHSGEFSGAAAGSEGSGYETAAALRFPASAAFESAPAPIEVNPRPSFLVAGHAACAAPCATEAASGLGPDVALANALASAGALARKTPEFLRAFIYTGGRLESGVEPGSAGLEARASYERELGRLGSLFATGAGEPPILAAASPDLTAGGTALFDSVFSPHGPHGGSSYYSRLFESRGEPPVLVVVLDYSSGVLGPEQKAWLRDQLLVAKGERFRSLVVGTASLGFSLPDPAPAGPVLQAADAAAVRSILFEGGASAYFYDYPGANVRSWMASGDLSIPVFGTGALGYSQPRGGSSDWLGSSAALLANFGHDEPEGSNIFPVTVRAIPQIESLSMRNDRGSRLNAGETVLFEGLGRRPAAGIRVEEEAGVPRFAGPEPYEVLPFASPELRCRGANCDHRVAVEYRFSSSDPEVGDFLTRAGEGGIKDPDRNKLPDETSPLFCAKEPGRTTVSITAGGLSYSTPVTVTADRVRPSCWREPLDAPLRKAKPQPPAPRPEVQTTPTPSPAPAAPAPQAPPPPQLLAPPPTAVPVLPPVPAAIVPPPWPVIVQPPAPPGALHPVSVASPVSAPAPGASPAVSPAEREEAVAAREAAHEMRAQSFARPPLTVVASSSGSSVATGAVLTAAAGALAIALLLVSASAPRVARSQSSRRR